MSKIWTVESGSDRTIVSFDGEVDFSNASALERTLLDELGKAPTVVIDMRGLRFLDSSGLRALLRVQIQSREAGSRVVLVKGPPTVQRLLDITGRQAGFEFIDTIEATDDSDEA